MPSLCIGCDIGKKSHHIAFHFPQAKQKRQPVFAVQNEREAFNDLLRKMQIYAPASECAVLLESTGHYGAALIQFLQEHGVAVYRISPKQKYGANVSKSDANDARTLARLLYQQLVQGAMPIEKSWHVRKLIPACPISRLLRGLVQDRLELSRELARRKNKLVSIEDELFPERKQIFASPYSNSALAFLTSHPSPQSIAHARIDTLVAARPGHYPARTSLEKLQTLATTTIGTKDENRQKSLLLRQELLVAELGVHQGHIDRIDEEISHALISSREGQILCSITGIGQANAATLLAHIGSIANFERRSQLRAFLGWAPRGSQTGTSYDVEKLDRKRNKPMRALIFLIVSVAIQHDPYWKALYEKLVPVKCVYDARKKDHVGKMKVVGCIAGQIIDVIFVLLRKDHDLVESWKGKDGPLPPPQLYDPSKLGKQRGHGTTPPAREHAD